jgi:hypothetical protein
MVMEVGKEMRESQYARQGPAIPAPEMSTLSGVVVGSDIVGLFR